MQEIDRVGYYLSVKFDLKAFRVNSDVGSAVRTAAVSKGCGCGAPWWLNIACNTGRFRKLCVACFRSNFCSLTSISGTLFCVRDLHCIQHYSHTRLFCAQSIFALYTDILFFLYHLCFWMYHMRLPLSLLCCLRNAALARIDICPTAVGLLSAAE